MSDSKNENLLPHDIDSWSWCRSKGGEEEKLTFAWTIERFSECPEQNGQFLCSSKFTISGPNDLETHWKSKVYPKGLNKESKGCLSVYLVNETKANVYAKYCFYILDSSNSIRNRLTFPEDPIHMFEPTTDWGFKQFLKLSIPKGVLPTSYLPS